VYDTRHRHQIAVEVLASGHAIEPSGAILLNIMANVLVNITYKFIYNIANNSLRCKKINFVRIQFTKSIAFVLSKFERTKYNTDEEDKRKPP